MIFVEILEGVFGYRSHRYAVYQNIGYLVVSIRGDGEGLIPPFGDGDHSGWSDTTVGSGSSRDGIGRGSGGTTTGDEKS